jgi:isochorismate hydrolase
VCSLVNPRSGNITTARQANERGYELTIVTYAITDPDEGAHHNSPPSDLPEIAEVATTEEVLTSLESDHRAFEPVG